MTIDERIQQARREYHDALADKYPALETPDYDCINPAHITALTEELTDCVASFIAGQINAGSEAEAIAEGSIYEDIERELKGYSTEEVAPKHFTLKSYLADPKTIKGGLNADDADIDLTLGVLETALSKEAPCEHIATEMAAIAQHFRNLVPVDEYPQFNVLMTQLAQRIDEDSIIVYQIFQDSDAGS